MDSILEDIRVMNIVMEEFAMDSAVPGDICVSEQRRRSLWKKWWAGYNGGACVVNRVVVEDTGVEEIMDGAGKGTVNDAMEVDKIVMAGKRDSRYNRRDGSDIDNERARTGMT